jgi:hypothetical protein
VQATASIERLGAAATRPSLRMFVATLIGLGLGLLIAAALPLLSPPQQAPTRAHSVTAYTSQIVPIPASCGTPDPMFAAT